MRLLIEKEENVVIVHCNHGKGRTGTAIMCYLLLNGFKGTCEEVLTYYNEKRFSKKGYKIDQPCQLRYVSFFKDVLDRKEMFKKLRAFRLVSVSSEGLSSHYLRVRRVRDQSVIY